jgi:hypothetical protein
MASLVATKPDHTFLLGVCSLSVVKTRAKGFRVGVENSSRNATPASAGSVAAFSSSWVKSVVQVNLHGSSLEIAVSSFGVRTNPALHSQFSGSSDSISASASRVAAPSSLTSSTLRLVRASASPQPSWSRTATNSKGARPNWGRGTAHLAALPIRLKTI